MLTVEFAARASVGLLPVLLFLAALVYLDSYKLVSLRAVLTAILLGGAAAGVSYVVNVLLMGQLGLEPLGYSRYVAPATEELLKGLVVIYLIRSNRVGFLVDAAIFGFAIGTGFAMIENLYYLQLLTDTHIAVWIVRGFGTAIMHGGATAIFAIISHALVERRDSTQLPLFLPGLLVAVSTHTVFNHFPLSPVLSTVGILALLPPLIYAVFQHSERSLAQWLGQGFDAHTELLDLINSGQFSRSKVGTYLHSLKEKFRGEVVADLLCYLRLHVELALRAKGLLMMRESGFNVGVDAETRAKFEEMRYLERSIGKTGRLALQPFLQMSRKDLWELYVLDNA